VYRPILMDVQKWTCLYCHKKLSKQSQVDHSVPWSRCLSIWGTTSS
jgi:hypothetical protein